MMTEETPGKVMGLLTAALASMAFLFIVSATNASFEGTLSNVPDPFSQQNVVAVLDGVSHGYSNFLDSNLLQPAQNDIAFFKYNLNWVVDNSDQQILAMLGLQALANPYGPIPGGARVAGAYTSAPSPKLVQSGQSEGFGVTPLYHMLIR